MATNDKVAVGSWAVTRPGIPEGMGHNSGPFPVGYDDYYADGSNGITDVSTAYTNDSNAADGLTSTYAEKDAVLGGELIVKGTTAPATIDGATKVTGIRVRIYYACSGAGHYVQGKLYNSGGTQIGMTFGGNGVWGLVSLGSPAYSSWEVAYGGEGLTVADLQDLQVGVESLNSSSGTFRIYKIEMRVFHNRADALYIIAQDNANKNMVIGKSTDGGANWSEQDPTGPPTMTQSGKMWDAVVGAGKIHIGYQDQYVSPSGMTPGLQALRYVSFDCATDSWDTDEAIDSTSISNNLSGNYFGTSLCVVGTGEVYAFYNGDDYNNMGSAYQDIKCCVRSAAGSWGTPFTVTDQGTQDNLGVTCSPYPNANGLIAYAWVRGFAVSVNDVDTSDDSLGTRQDSIFTSTSHFNGFKILPQFNDGTNNVTMLGGADDQIRKMSFSTSFGALGGESTALWSAVALSNYGQRGAWYATDGDVYLVGADQSGQDIYIDISAGGASSGWGTDTAIELNVGASLFLHGASIYTHTSANGGDTVLGIYFSAAGSMYYDEYVIAAGGGGGPTDEHLLALRGVGT